MRRRLIAMSGRQHGLRLDDADSIFAPASITVITVIITQPAMSPRSLGELTST
jgi:hypothetical protein